MTIFPFDLLTVDCQIETSLEYLFNLHRDMLQSTDAFPLNFGFTGKGNSTRSDGIALGLEEQVKAGAIG